MVGFAVTAIFIALFAGLNSATGAAVSPPPKVLPSRVKLSKRLLPTAPPPPCSNSTFNLKLGLLSEAAIAEKSKVASAGSPSLGATVVNVIKVVPSTEYDHNWFPAPEPQSRVANFTTTFS